LREYLPIGSICLEATSMADPTENKKQRKGRSPNYPGLDLGAALEKARALYQRERNHAAAVETILEHWGYKPKSGGGLVAFAALKKFGLVEDSGTGADRKAKLTARALDIIHDERSDSKERRDAIRAAALEPSIHRELFDTYKGVLPSDQNLRYNLLRERGFTESGANEFIREIRATFTFAGITGSGSLSDEEEDKPSESEDGMSAAAEPLVSDSRRDQEEPESKDFTFTVTLYGGRLATVKAPVPMTKRNLERLQRMIADQLEPFVDGDDPKSS
jgi:hypothetical protein